MVHLWDVTKTAQAKGKGKFNITTGQRAHKDDNGRGN